MERRNGAIISTIIDKKGDTVTEKEEVDRQLALPIEEIEVDDLPWIIKKTFSRPSKLFPKRNGIHCVFPLNWKDPSHE